MSRRSNKSTKESSSNSTTTVNKANKSNESHPQEHSEQYRAFLMRSLDRCDTELAALVKLNRSLRDARSTVVETCGEQTLLDIGQGLVQLDHDNDGLLQREEHKAHIPNTPEGQEVCIDFMLRMKLRRKLLNRLSRRLSRLAHAMDGEDVQPPHPPKYGDLGFQHKMSNKQALQDFAVRFEKQQDLIRKIQMKNESLYNNSSSGIPETEEQQETTGESSSAPHDEHSSAIKDKDNDDDKTHGDDMDQETTTTETKEEGTEEEPKSEPAKAADESKATGEFEEKDSDKEKSSKSENEEKPQEKDQSQKPEIKAEGVVSLSSKSPTDQAADKDDDGYDYEVLRDYDEAYTKEIIPSTGAVSYPILEKKDEEDYTYIKYGAGIGATHRTMSSKDKEAEFRRWQTAVLGRIPNQPTFEELGMKNRVFFLDERRKQLAEEKSVSSPLKTNKKHATAEEDNDSDSEKDSDQDDEVEMAEANDDDDEECKDEKDTGDGEDTEMQVTDDDGKVESKTEKEEPGAKAAPIKPVKPISLVAVPSYHEQDQKRLRLIHMDLMGASMHDYARHRVAEATQDYNRTFRTSSELYNYRVKLQADLGQVSYANRMKLAQLSNQFSLDVAVHRKRWEKRHREHALGQLPSAYGKVARGTPMTFQFASSADPVASNVGKVLADIVDVVDRRGENGWRREDCIEAFVPPPYPDFNEYIDEGTGETFGQSQERIEGGMRRELAEVSTKLHISEEDRKRAWKTLLKTKAEFDMPHTTTSGGRSVSFAPHQFHLLPVPPLTSSVSASVMPSTHHYSSASFPSYVPPPAAALPVAPAARNNCSESKYSAAKVRERIAPDGSVMPASEPKKKDGMYVRPPGRGRQGMDWDEVRGLWVKAPP